MTKTEENVNFSHEQILRLAMLVNFPSKSEPAIKDLIKALLKAETPAMAESIIDFFTDDANTETRCPMAAEIKSAIIMRLDPMLPDPDCPKCKGAGFPIIDLPDGTTAAGSYCSCHARRKPPRYPGPGDEPVGDLAVQVGQLAGSKRA